MLSSLNALVVEDSAIWRAFVVAVLESEGFEVTTAKSGFEAMKILVELNFNLLVINNQLTDMSGLKLVRYVRDNPIHKSYKEIPIIIMRTDGRLPDRAREMKLGVSEYLIHPFSPKALINIARRLLTQSPNKSSH